MEHMTDITERLRRLYLQNGTDYVQEAADTIERLRSEVAALRALSTEHALSVNIPPGALRIELD